MLRLLSAGAACGGAALAAPRAAYVVADARSPTGVRAAEGAPPPAGALAWATYDASALNTTGWGLLTVVASAAEPNATLAGYAAGYIEGWLTVAEIASNARNTGSDAPNSKKLQRFLDDNFAWMTGMVAARAATDAYWAHVGTVVAQLQGLADGQAAAGGAQTWAQMYQGLLNGGDMFNLGDLYGLSEEQAARTPALRRSKAAGAAPPGTRNDHCSAMVRLTPGAADIVVTHTTWAGFESLGRILKRYDLAFPSIGGGVAVPGRFTALSAFPGSLQYSSDDFYVLSSGLVTLETTIDNNNLTLARQYASTEVVLEWLRNILANRLATDGPSWAATFSRFASGTYTNQWMVVDSNLFTPGTTPPDHTLTVLEELPGNIAVRDGTPYLRGDAGYELWGGAAWASYNVIFDPRLFVLSGAQELVDKYGGVTGPGAYYSLLNTSRANIFRRGSAGVDGLETMQKHIRLNEFTTDPLSRLGCGSAPPYSASNAIADRSDLNLKNGDYKIPDLGHGDSAGIDAKVTLLSWVKAAALGKGELPLVAQSGPTISASCPTFAFSNASVKVGHEGLPDVYSFDWVVKPCPAMMG